MKKAHIALAAALLLANCGVVSAQGGFPSKPVRLIVGFTSGSEIDIVARLLAEQMSERWGQRVIVDNRTGAGGTVAGAIVARATPDGYTWFFNSVAHTASRALYSKLPYDPLRDFAFVSQATSAPNVVVTAPSQAIRSLGALIALAKQKPGQLVFGATGVGGGTHINGTLFRLAAGIDVVHAPYKGGPEILVDTMTARIHYAFSPIGSTVAFVKEGRLTALGVTTLQRSPALPDVPTVAEVALPGFEWDQWYGMLVPAGVPPAIVGAINTEMKRIMSAAAMTERLRVRGSWPTLSTPAQFEKKVRGETEKVTKALVAAGVKPQ